MDFSSQTEGLGYTSQRNGHKSIIPTKHTQPEKGTRNRTQLLLEVHLLLSMFLEEGIPKSSMNSSENKSSGLFTRADSNACAWALSGRDTWMSTTIDPRAVFTTSTFSTPILAKAAMSLLIPVKNPPWFWRIVYSPLKVSLSLS